MGPGEAIVTLIAMGLPTLFLLYLINRFFRLKERRLEIDAGAVAEKTAQYAAHTHELEARVRVLEQIVTDGGAQTAAQIEALRDAPRLATGEKVR